MQAAPRPWWDTVPLRRMSRPQWESLCDGCGRCCLHKLRDDDGAIHWTDVACRLLDRAAARCGDYANRARTVPDCVRLTPAALDDIDWLPPSCAYRLLAEGRTLPSWHPLRTGDPDSVREAGVSVAGRVVDERTVRRLEHRIVDWPGRLPRAAHPPTPPRARPAIRRHRASLAR
jgi:uncharacterized protein